MTLEVLHVIRDYTLTRTSIPNHTNHRKDMTYALIRSIKNTESLTKSLQNKENMYYVSLLGSLYQYVYVDIRSCFVLICIYTYIVYGDERGFFVAKEKIS